MQKNKQTQLKKDNGFDLRRIFFESGIYLDTLWGILIVLFCCVLSSLEIELFAN